MAVRTSTQKGKATAAAVGRWSDRGGYLALRRLHPGNVGPMAEVGFSGR